MRIYFDALVATLQANIKIPEYRAGVDAVTRDYARAFDTVLKQPELAQRLRNEVLVSPFVEQTGEERQ